MSNQIDFSKKQYFNGEKSVKESYGSKNYMKDIVCDDKDKLNKKQRKI